MFLGPATVLVVEDDSMIRMGVITAVQDEGYLVLSAANADEALRVLDAHPDIDVLFTDIRMPGSMDGLALANRVHQSHPQMEIVIASGNLQPASDRMPLGARFLPKPYEILQIGDVLRDLIDQTRPFVLADDLPIRPVRF